MTCLQLCVLFNFQILVTFSPVFMNIFFRSRLTLYKCVVSPCIQRPWWMRNWTISRRNGIVAKLRHFLTLSQLRQLYYSIIYPYISYAILAWGIDFLKSPSSCLFSTRRTKDFSYLIGANQTGRCASTNQRSPGYPLGTDLSNYAQINVTCG